ncbi:MAG: ATP cone domain-containing protein [Nanoarchaeota archaeon]
MTYVIKASGEKEEFDKKKIERTTLKAGASKRLAKEIANKIERKVYEGITTKEILEIALKSLKDKPEVALRYDLKRAIMSLGPSGFPFEKFFAAVLENHDYKTKVGLILRGKATTHEVDILAETKENKKYIIECKYHNQLGTYTDSKVAMYTYARFLDLYNNPKNKINQGWLVTNTKCTPHAIQYAKGVGLKITSWQYPSNESLQKLIMKKRLYPITILKSINSTIKEKLSQANIILARDLIDLNLNELKIKTKLPENILIRIIKEARGVCTC